MSKIIQVHDPLKSNSDILILGIESSCDDTSAAVIKNDKILANVTAGQDVHKLYGSDIAKNHFKGSSICFHKPKKRFSNITILN